jgi:hypothetical protein
MKLILLIVLKMLNYIRYEYYEICWKLIKANCVGRHLRKHDFIINKLLFKLESVSHTMKTWATGFYKIYSHNFLSKIIYGTENGLC